MNTEMTIASEVFTDDLEDILDAIQSDVEKMPGGTADFTPAATATPCAVAVSIAIMC